MDFDRNKNETLFEFNPKTPVDRDINWFQSVGIKYKQNVLTDLEYSENVQYNDTISRFVPPEKMESFGVPSAQKMTKEGADYYDNLINSGEITFDKNGVQLTGRQDTNAVVWNTLKNKGFTPDSFHQKVIEDTQKQHTEYAQDLSSYDKDNIWGQSGSADFVADIGSWLSDPPNLFGLGLEVSAFKAFSTGLLKEGRATSTAMANRITGGSIGEIGALSSKYGKQPVVEALNFITKMRGKGASSAEIIGMFKNKGTGVSESFKDPKTQKVITDLIKKGRLEEIGAVAGFSGVMAGVTEWIHQLGTFDFKSAVLKDYDETQKNTDIALNTGFGFVFGGLFNVATNILHKPMDEAIAATDIGASVTTDGVMKASADVSADMPISVNATEPLIKEEVTINKDIEIDKVVEEMEQREDFRFETDAHNKVVDEFEKARQCIIERNSQVDLNYKPEVIPSVSSTTTIRG